MPIGPGHADAAAAPRRHLSTSPSARSIWIWRDKVALLLVVGIPLLAFALLAGHLQQRRDPRSQGRRGRPGPVRDLADLRPGDQSAPGVSVAERSSDLNNAMHAVRSGKAIAAVYIPREPRARHHRRAPAADRHLLQQAVLHAGQRRLERAAGCGLGGASPDLPTARRRDRRSRPARSSSSNMCSPIRR